MTLEKLHTRPLGEQNTNKQTKLRAEADRLGQGVYVVPMYELETISSMVISFNPSTFM